MRERPGVLLALGALLVGCAIGEPARAPSPPSAPAAPPAPEPVAAPTALPDHARWGGVETELRGEGELGIVLLHGYGATATDMVSLGEHLAAAIGARVAIPAAPRTWAHGGDGRAWFERSSDHLDAEVEAAAAEIAAVRDGLVAEGRDASDVVVAGFSQGGSLAIECGLALHPRPRAIVVFSGRVLDRFGGRWDALAGMPVFVSHGHDDPLIPFSDGALTDRRAREAGALVTFVPFDGAHEMTPEVIAAAVDFLRPLAAR